MALSSFIRIQILAAVEYKTLFLVVMTAELKNILYVLFSHFLNKISVFYAPVFEQLEVDKLIAIKKKF